MQSNPKKNALESQRTRANSPIGLSSPLDCSVVELESLAACTTEPHKSGVLIAEDKHLSGELSEALAVSQLQKRLTLAGTTYFTTAKICQHSHQNVGATLARRIQFDAHRPGSLLAETLSYWIGLTRIRHRPFRVATSVLLFQTIYEATNLVAADCDHILIDLIGHVWNSALRRLCSDTDANLRAFALKMTGACSCKLPAIFWSPDTADILLRGVGDATKTVSINALQQMSEVARHPGCGSLAANLESWQHVFMSLANKPSFCFTESRCWGLEGLLGLALHSPQHEVDLEEARALLADCVRLAEPARTLAAAVRLVWLNPRETLTFIEIITMSLSNVQGFAEPIGEALALVDAPSAVAYLESRLQYTRNSVSEHLLQAMLGVGKHVSDRIRFHLASLCLKQDVTAQQYALRLLALVRNKRSTRYFDLIERIAQRGRAACQLSGAIAELVELWPVELLRYAQQRKLFPIKVLAVTPVSLYGLALSTGADTSCHPVTRAHELWEALRSSSSHCRVMFDELVESLHPTMDLESLHVVTRILVWLYRALHSGDKKRSGLLKESRIVKMNGAPMYEALVALASKDEVISSGAYEDVLVAMRILEHLGAFADSGAHAVKTKFPHSAAAKLKEIELK